LIDIERAHVDFVVGTFDDHPVNPEPIERFIKGVSFYRQSAVVFQRRILVGNHAHGPTRFIGMRILFPQSPDLGRRQRFVAGAKRT